MFLTQPHLYCPPLPVITRLLSLSGCLLSFFITTGNLVQTLFTFREHLRLCFGCLIFIFGLDLDLITCFQIDSFCQLFLAVSRPRLDLNFEFRIIMNDHLNHLRDTTETINFGYLHGYPYNQHENNDHCPFKIRSQIVMLR